MNLQPKTFHELKASNLRNQLNQDNKFGVNLHQLDPSTKLCFSNNNQLRKTPTSYCLRKNLSELFTEPDTRVQCG